MTLTSSQQDSTIPALQHLHDAHKAALAAEEAAHRARCERAREVARLMGEGWSASVISSELGVHRRMLYKWRDNADEQSAYST